MKVGGRVKLAGELTVRPATNNEGRDAGANFLLLDDKNVLECEKCQHPLTFDDNGILVCRHCRPL